MVFLEHWKIFLVSPASLRLPWENFCKHTHFIVSMSFLTNSGNSGVYPAVLHFISIHWNIICVKLTSVLCICVLYLYCLFFKCMASFVLYLYCLFFKFIAPLYYRANLLTIPTSIGYTPEYGILGNKIWMNEWIFVPKVEHSTSH